MSPELQEFLKQCGGAGLFFTLITAMANATVGTTDSWPKWTWLIPLALLIVSFALGLAGKLRDMEEKDYIKELGAKMAAQDKLSTSYPFWVVMRDVEHPTSSDYSDGRKRREDSWKLTCDNCRALSIDGAVLPDDCDDCDEDCFYDYRSVGTPDLEHGVFFTQEACAAYIKARSYAMGLNAHPYAFSAYFSVEMKAVMRHLLEQGGAEPNLYR